MLAKFSVKNFKSFEKELVFDLSQTEDYDFNKKCIKNGIANKAIIYGYNGVGKSNLALAVMDIVINLTDKEKSSEHYSNYLNANSTEQIAEFSYTFIFNKDKIEYNYGKNSYENIVHERLSINNKKIICCDKRTGKLSVNLEGTETFIKNITGIKSLEISILKGIKSNAVLSNKDANVKIFNKLMEYVNNMLLFWNLDTRTYLGYKNGNTNIMDYIIRNEKFDEFSNFLEKTKLGFGLKYLKYENGPKGYRFYYDYPKKHKINKIDFWDSCSSGTKSLVLLYYWLFARNAESKPSFVFIDEFDAFYHFELSKFVVEKLKEISCQVILTTHNTSIMNNDILRPDCYFFMYNEKIKSLVSSTNKELRFVHDIEKMYKAGAFNG
jgi:AAA15 family ATPase/GTPase